jgi:hypothetical protein
MTARAGTGSSAAACTRIGRRPTPNPLVYDELKVMRCFDEVAETGWAWPTIRL